MTTKLQPGIYPIRNQAGEMSKETGVYVFEDGITGCGARLNRPVVGKWTVYKSTPALLSAAQIEALASYGLADHQEIA